MEVFSFYGHPESFVDQKVGHISNADQAQHINDKNIDHATPVPIPQPVKFDAQGEKYNAGVDQGIIKSFTEPP